MKTILAPTDFSKIARNAIDYAVEIAKSAQAKLILFHVFQIPVIPGEVPIMLPIDEMEKNAMDGLNKIRESILSKGENKLLIECRCESGLPAEEINLFAEKNKVDLIIMGMAGAGYLTEKIVGSITTSLIRKTTYPIVVVDKHVKFKNMKRIALACDFSESGKKSVLKPLKTLADLFKSHIYIVNVVPKSETIAPISMAVAGIKLDHLLETTAHSFHYIKNDDVIEGLNKFIKDKEIDVLTMIPHTHSILTTIFQEPNTKRMAFHTKTPLLILHE